MVKRTSKYLDAAALVLWANTFHFDVLDEWECRPECSVPYGYSDADKDWGFWVWLERNYPDLLDDFAVWWRDGLATGKLRRRSGDQKNQ